MDVKEDVCGTQAYANDTKLSANPHLMIYTN